jgi:NAD(P)-dependent dehydrogenase (short-subunit alcohol dehydrogenase family)
MTAPVVVYGAGHTSRFVVAELERRGYHVVIAGRDPSKLATLRAAHPAAEVRVAAIDDAPALDRALAGGRAILNCAGPFLDTATPLIEAALRARIHYLDVAAEQPSARATFERFAQRASAADIVVLPAMAFYGGLADLLATAATSGWTDTDEVSIAVALDSWRPTDGTRRTGTRNTDRRVVVADGRLTLLPDPAPRRTWQFPAPFGAQDVVAVPLSEVITISRHLRTTALTSYMNLAPLADLRSSDTTGPVAIDASGRSSQIFVMDVIARRNDEHRRARAEGRDIYAITAPLLVEAAARILDGRITRTGAAAPGELFDAHDFLRALATDLRVSYESWQAPHRDAAAGRPLLP